MLPRTTSRLFPIAALLAAAVCAAAAESTESVEFQPGADGAATVDAAGFESLQAAFDALPESGGMVAIPPGRYELAQPLVLSRGDVAIRGAGPATHLVNTNEEGAPAIRIAPPEGTKALWRIQIADLRVTGNPKSGPGIYANAVNEVLLSHVAVEHHGADGVVLDHCYEDPRVCACLITYNAGTGLNLLGCHDIVVSANQFEENVDALHCVNGYNLTMTGNNVDDHLGNGVVIENTYGSIVSGNMIEECTGHALVLEGACYGDAISANTFAHCKGEGVRLVGVRDITVSANTFVLLAEPALHALGEAAQLTITGNTFSRYPFDPRERHTIDPGQGIVLEGVRDVTVSGNTFTAARYEAIKVAGDANMRLCITGNTILNPSQGAPGEHAAVALANVTRSIFANNIVTDDQEPPTMKRALELTGDCDLNVMTSNILPGAVQ
ncbi:MAG: right-handed parallel beta-helix repeat-containing protein [Candidatus Hydrogenedentes bacterium]|nr:right-handed parallel beta-helix repeat-containing protein [Candidatus Hydrogenedentota bacterium]